MSSRSQNQAFSADWFPPCPLFFEPPKVAGSLEASSKLQLWKGKLSDPKYCVAYFLDFNMWFWRRDNGIPTHPPPSGPPTQPRKNGRQGQGAAPSARLTEQSRRSGCMREGVETLPESAAFFFLGGVPCCLPLTRLIFLSVCLLFFSGSPFCLPLTRPVFEFLLFWGPLLFSTNQAKMMICFAGVLIPA